MDMNELDKQNGSIVEKMVTVLDETSETILTDEQKKEVYERFKKFMEELFAYLNLTV